MMAKLRTAISWLAYPLITSGAVAFCLWALARHWPAWAIGIVVVAVACALTEGLERVIPYSRAWAVPRGDRGTDLWHLVLSNRTFDIGTFIAISLFAPVGGWLSKQLGVALWPHTWPLLLQALIALILVELPWYWIHRLEHELPLLWRVHSVHHSSQRIYWWNLARNHPFDNLASAVASMALLALLGVGEGALSIVAAFSGAHAMLQHSNADLRTGALDLILATARVHRWHHSPHLHESQANYCPTLTLWDYVFGTRRFDKHAAPPEDVGLGPDGDGFPQGYLAQVMVPFDARRWHK
jgi:sterol desaturase/sphingolipid hydroxylase (fatty acid hydroxylase superfamily)